MKNIPVDLIIFDFDQTLVLTEELTFNIENDIAVSMGFAPMSRELHKKTFGIPIEDAIQVRIPGINLPEFLVKFTDSIKLSVAKGEFDAIPQQNLDTLDKLIEQGKKLAVVTSRTLEEARHLMAPEHYLNKRIKKFYYKGSSDFSKPNPKVFEKPLRDLGVNPEHAVYVGDSPGDGIASKGAGLYFIASLENGFRTEEDFKDIEVDCFIRKFPELLEKIF